MKIRQGFVSNSSSSSFVCSVCGESYSGYDGQYDVAYCECFNNHEICGDCFGPINKVIKSLSEDIPKAIEMLSLDVEFSNDLLGEEDKFTWIKQYVTEDALDPIVCPICNLSDIPKWLESEYLLEKFGLDRSVIHNEIRATYKNLEAWEKRNEN